jgi:hypothetical protein
MHRLSVLAALTLSACYHGSTAHDGGLDLAAVDGAIGDLAGQPLDMAWTFGDLSASGSLALHEYACPPELQNGRCLTPFPSPGF